MPRPKHPPRRAPKGASMQEYAILLGLLGGTVATLVGNFGADIRDGFVAATAVQQSHLAQARGSTLAFLPGPLPGARTGVPYVHNLAPFLSQRGFHASDGAVSWSAEGLPAGLRLNDAGVLSGNVTTGEHRFTVEARRAGIVARTALVLVATP